ncbi:hypothetical protein LUZ60_000706 [Juncus effusus]|nr:hypothetical protein LUZ60_000706 [Juncus effusus]
MEDKLKTLTSNLAGLMIVWSMANQFLPPQLREIILNLTRKVKAYFSPYIDFTIEEYTSEGMTRHELYTAAKAYLSEKCSKNSRLCTVELSKSGNFLTGLGDYVTVTDYFRGAQIWWYASKHERGRDGGGGSEQQVVGTEPRYYRLTFHQRHRNLIEQQYLKQILDEGRAVLLRNRQRRLFTNSRSNCWFQNVSQWTYVPFNHPSTFGTLAMDPVKKQDILNDLTEFKKGKEHYNKTGKAWKRGYLLYGPPGTGKSSMIAAIANYMEYDVYDLELTAVDSNTELRKLLIATTNKSIIVIEDIDCSLNLTGKRDGSTKKKNKKKQEEEVEVDPNKVTLSGLLNFTDGLWSVCGEERIIIFTTNHVEKLDEALIRAGRMDKHIEMSYCCFEAFKVLAKNYLGVDGHPLFDSVRNLIEKVHVTPADVAEQLMDRGFLKDDHERCLKKLIKVLEAKKDKGKEAGGE